MREPKNMPEVIGAIQIPRFPWRPGQVEKGIGSPRGVGLQYDGLL
jgi:hypothetical protein